MSPQETTHFDTHAAVKRLTEAGMPVSQAEAVAASQEKVMLHNLATKQNMYSFRSETAERFVSTNKSIEALRAEVADCHRDIALTRKDVESLRTELKTDIESLRSETHKAIGIIHKAIESLRAEAT